MRWLSDSFSGATVWPVSPALASPALPSCDRRARDEWNVRRGAVREKRVVEEEDWKGRAVVAELELGIPLAAGRRQTCLLACAMLLRASSIADCWADCCSTSTSKARTERRSIAVVCVCVKGVVK